MAHIEVEVSKLKNIKGRIVGYRASLADVYVDGATATEAIANLQGALTSRCTINRIEEVSIQHGEYVAHVWRGFNGIESRLYHPDGHVSMQSHTGDIETAENGVRLHIAQLCWPASNAAEVIARDDDRGHREFKGWVEFQERYSIAKARGMNSNDAHSFAGRNPSRPELWREVNAQG